MGRRTRFLDRFFDQYVMNNMSAPVFDALRPEGSKDPFGVDKAMGRLSTAYDWLEANLGDGPWAIGEQFTLADCAAAPSLFYADWVQEIGPERPQLSAYRARLLAHPSVARAVDEGRPYRSFFPLGAPDRD
jgi:glutathione S-transferase